MFYTLWRATRTEKKAVPLITCLAKNNFARAAHFFVYFFAGVLHDHNVKLRSYTFYKENVFLFAFFHCLSFSPWWPLEFHIFSPPL